MDFSYGDYIIRRANNPKKQRNKMEDQRPPKKRNHSAAMYIKRKSGKNFFRFLPFKNVRRSQSIVDGLRIYVEGCCDIDIEEKILI